MVAIATSFTSAFHNISNTWRIALLYVSPKNEFKTSPNTNLELKWVLIISSLVSV